MQYSSAKDIVNAIKPLVGVRSYIASLNNDTEILIADDKDNVQRIKNIIRTLDTNLDTTISEFNLTNLSSIEALRIINNLKADTNTRFDTLG